MEKMKVISNVEFGTFLRDKPLYSKFRVTQSFTPGLNTYTYPTDFDDISLNLYCKQDRVNQTFKTACYQIGQQYKMAPPSLNNMIERTLPPFWDKTTRTLDFTLPITAECQFCHSKIYYLLNIVSDGPFNAAESTYPNIYIQKVGQNPAFDMKPEKEVLNYLTKEDQQNYSRALANLSVSFGIGAYAYFRRIIENEIKSIAKDIVGLDNAHSAILKEAYSQFEEDHQMSKLIESLNPYIPHSLKGLGDNPLKLLYEQLSGGIHLLPDEECLARAQSIDLILRFTIRKLAEEKKEVGSIRSAMQNLRNAKNSKL